MQQWNGQSNKVRSVIRIRFKKRKEHDMNIKLLQDHVDCAMEHIDEFCSLCEDEEEKQVFVYLAAVLTDKASRIVSRYLDDAQYPATVLSHVNVEKDRTTVTFRLPSGTIVQTGIDNEGSHTESRWN